jgi:hypothetical protein
MVYDNMKDLIKKILKEETDIMDSFTYFETSKGSKYIINDKGQLRRWKSYHENTSGEDMGLHSWSDLSFFVDPSYYSSVSSFEQLNTNKGYKVAISKDAEGKMFYMIFDNNQWRPAKWEDAFPTYVKNNPELKNKVLSWRYVREPKIGYNVVDVSFKKQGSTQLSSFHIGNTVSRIEDRIPDDERNLFTGKRS